MADANVLTPAAGAAGTAPADGKRRIPVLFIIIVLVVVA